MREERAMAAVSAGVDVEEIESTKSDKLLAVVLALFLLLGGVWAYVKVDDYVRGAIGVPVPTVAETAAMQRLSAAESRLVSLREAEGRTRQELELDREAYRTALDADRPAAALEREYRTAERAHDLVTAQLAAAEAAVAAARPAAERAYDRVGADHERRLRLQSLVAFAARLALVVASILFAYRLLARMRRLGSRYFPVALAFAGYAAVLALVLGADYLTDYVDPLDLGPLFLSLFGIAATLLALVALQRHLARRLPHRRARRRECPYCSFPLGSTEHCEGCGRSVIAACGSCGSTRRVGTPHCGACGAG
jgi:hypothetical protein